MTDGIDRYAEPVTVLEYSYQSPIVPLPIVPTLAQIQRLEAHLRTLPQLDADNSHHFADGIYGRELRIPKGAILTGKMHKQQHLNFLMKGDITVWTEQGMKRLVAPAIIVSEPGCKRVGYAHEDCVWVTVHASKETDLALLEAELIEPELPLIDGGPARIGEAPCHGQQ